MAAVSASGYTKKSASLSTSTKRYEVVAYLLAYYNSLQPRD